MANAEAKKSPSNIVIKREGNVLFIGIDTTKRVGPSKTGKTTLVGTTHGTIDAGDGIQLSVNAYTKAK